MQHDLCVCVHAANFLFHSYTHTHSQTKTQTLEQTVIAKTYVAIYVRNKSNFNITPCNNALFFFFLIRVDNFLDELSLVIR